MQLFTLPVGPFDETIPLHLAVPVGAMWFFQFCLRARHVLAPCVSVLQKIVSSVPGYELPMSLKRCQEKVSPCNHQALL